MKPAFSEILLWQVTACSLQGFFDTARLELAEYNIGVQIIMPGPVKSNILENCYTENVNVVSKYLTRI